MEITYKCSVCGNEVLASDDKPKVDSWGNVTVTLQPCEECIETATSEGYNEAKDEMEESKS